MKLNTSQFWFDDIDNGFIDDFLGVENLVNKPRRDLIELASMKRAISNFVNIVTGKSIPVKFHDGTSSYTSGKDVVIGANLTEDSFDNAVGLALHEGSHILLSDFNILKNLEFEIPAELFLLAENKNIKRNEVLKMVKNVLNYMEDRRIDYYIFSTSPGYKNYYHSMYDKHFYSKSIDKGLLSAEFRTETVESYMFRIINLHNKNRQLGSLKGLRKIYSTIDLRNISRFKTTNDVFVEALKVANIIINSIDKVEFGDEEGNEADGKSGNSTETGAGDDTLSDEEFDDLLDSIENGEMETGETGDGNSSNGKTIELPLSTEDEDLETPTDNMSNDNGSEPVELSDRQKSLLKKAIEKQEKFLDGDLKKTKLTKKELKDLSTIEESGSTYKDVGHSYGHGTVKCLVVKKLTQDLIESKQFNICSSWGENEDFVDEGLRLGTVLGKKLKVRTEERSLKYTRRSSGKIDRRLISELGFNNDRVFQQVLTDRFNKAHIHISIDASGSMYGDKWTKAMTSAVAMIKACEMAGNIDVVVTLRSTHRNGGYRRSNSDIPLIMVVYDSKKDKLHKVKSLFKYLRPAGITPEGLTFEAILEDLIPGTDSQDSYFINYSDGQPYFSSNEFYSYYGNDAAVHTRKQVDMMRNRGIKIMSYFISSSDYTSNGDRNIFKTMYGKDASFINSTNMMEVAKTMNKRFLGQ